MTRLKSTLAWALLLFSGAAALLCLMGMLEGRLQFGPYYADALAGIMGAYNPGHGAGGPDQQAFPSGSATFGYLFDDAADECVYCEIQLPHGYVEGTPLYCHMHWSPLTTSTNKVVWQFDYTLAGTNVSFPAAQQLYVQAAGGGTANRHQIDSFPTLACPTCTLSTVLLAKVCRDANGTNATDDMAGDVAGHYFDCHVLINTPGSWTELAK